VLGGADARVANGTEGVLVVRRDARGRSHGPEVEPHGPIPDSRGPEDVPTEAGLAPRGIHGDMGGCSADTPVDTARAHEIRAVGEYVAALVNPARDGHVVAIGEVVEFRRIERC